MTRHEIAAGPALGLVAAQESTAGAQSDLLATPRGGAITDVAGVRIGHLGAAAAPGAGGA
jgi:hypothetical protein